MQSAGLRSQIQPLIHIKSSNLSRKALPPFPMFLTTEAQGQASARMKVSEVTPGQ